jgi:hypothetical protein
MSDPVVVSEQIVEESIETKGEEKENFIMRSFIICMYTSPLNLV